MSLILALVVAAHAQDFGYVAIMAQARQALIAKDYKTAKTLLTAAEAAAPTSSSPLAQSDIAQLPFYRGLVEWRSGDRDKAALDWWRRVLVVSPQFEPDIELLPEADAQDVLYALRGEVRNYQQSPTGLPDEAEDVLVFIDGKRLAPEDMLTFGRHLVQVRCTDGNFEGAWYEYGKPPADYLTVCNGGSLASSGATAADARASAKVAAAKAAADRKATADKATAEKSAKEAEKKAAAERVLADKAAAEKSAKEAEKVLADKAAAEKVLADKAAAEKATAGKAAADKVTADKAAADKVTADKAAADKATAEKAAADKAAADKATAEKAAADKAAADKATADKAAAAKSTARVDPKKKLDVPAVLCMAAGGGMLAAGGVLNFAVVEPAYAAITEANEVPGSMSPESAAAWEGRFSVGSQGTIGLLGAGVAFLGAGVVLQVLDSPVVLMPNGVAISGSW